MDGCSSFSFLLEDFEQLNPLRYLRIVGCDKLEVLLGHLDTRFNLVAVDVSRCPLLKGETMDRLVEMLSLYFMDVRGSLL